MHYTAFRLRLDGSSIAAATNNIADASLLSIMPDAVMHALLGGLHEFTKCVWVWCFSVVSFRSVSSLGLPDLPYFTGAPVFQVISPVSRLKPIRETLSPVFRLL